LRIAAPRLAAARRRNCRRRGRGEAPVPTGASRRCARGPAECGCGEVFRKSAERRDLEVPPPIGPQFDVQNAHLEDVAGLGAFDVDRPREEVWPRPAKRAFQHVRVSGDRTKAERRIGQIIRLAGEGFDGHAVSGCDPKHRLQPSIPKSPLNVSGCGSKNEIHDPPSPTCATRNDRGR